MSSFLDKVLFSARRRKRVTKEFETYMHNCKEANGFKHCKPEQLILDGYFTKLLKAFCQLFKLEHRIIWRKTNFGLGLEVAVYVKTKQYESSIDVFKEGQVAYVSSMREYTQDADPSTPEEFSRKIVEGLFGEGRYLKSMKGGDSYIVTEDHQLEYCERRECHELPRTVEELMLKLTVAGIDPSQCKIQLEQGRW